MNKTIERIMVIAVALDYVNSDFSAGSNEQTVSAIDMDDLTSRLKR